MEKPLRLSRNMLHGWKDNLMLAKPLAAYTYLSSIISELYESMRKSKNRYFLPHFAIRLNAVWMEREFDAYELSRSMYPSIFNSFLVIRIASAKKLPFSRTAAHIFVSHGDTPAIIMQYVAWMERQFNACQTPRGTLVVRTRCKNFVMIGSVVFKL